MAAPRTLYARSGDVHLAYQVIGEGPRDVVLVLDWASHLEALWEQPFVTEVVSSLTRFARVLWFDMRGVGLSDRVVDEAVAAEEWMEGRGRRHGCGRLRAGDADRPRPRCADGAVVRGNAPGPRRLARAHQRVRTV